MNYVFIQMPSFSYFVQVFLCGVLTKAPPYPPKLGSVGPSLSLRFPTKAVVAIAPFPHNVKMLVTLVYIMIYIGACSLPLMAVLNLDYLTELKRHLQL